ncbi:hypothetical protein V6N13_070140 [Hibiscus sabdariffa]
MNTVDWKQFFFGGGDEQALDFFPSVDFEDSFIVDPPSEIFNEGSIDWKHALVGQFISAAPNFLTLKKIVELLWGKASLSKISLVGSNLYVFSFANVTARDWVLDNGPWHIQHKPLVLRKWEPNLKQLDFDLTRMSVWVQLYNVPLKLFSKKGLSYIASVLGVPLYMDSITASRERLEFAKVCVEVEAGRRIPRTTPVKMPDKSVVIVKESADAIANHVELTSDIEVMGNVVASVNEVIGDVVDSVSEAPSVKVAATTNFPPLQSPVVRQKGRGRRKGKMVNVKNKFEVLAGAEFEVLEDTKKPRIASLGVANLLQEMKAKKVEKIKNMVPEAIDVKGNALSLTSQ